MGWLTTEELCWNERGELTTHAPSTYKIPTASDVPADFRVRIWEKGINREQVVGRSKAVGEPPLMLGISVFHAINDAIASVTRRPPQPRPRCARDARARAVRDRGPEAPGPRPPSPPRPGRPSDCALNTRGRNVCGPGCHG